MIEKVLQDYLKECLTTTVGTSTVTVPVYMEVPEKMPDKFVVLEKTSGGMENHIYESTFAIRSYAMSMYDAACLNEEIKGYMLYGRTPAEVSGVRLNSDYNYTDTSTKRYRYQAVYDIYHY